MRAKELTDKEYKFVFSRVPRLCLDFVILKGNKILLAKRNINPCKGCWSLPGGMVRYKESIKDASIRILTNELGLKPVKNKLIGFIEFPNEINKNGVHVYSVSIVFLTKLQLGKATGNDHIDEVVFFKKLPENVHPLQKEFLKKNWSLLLK